MAKETLGLANLQFRAKYPSFRFTPSFDSRVTFPPASAYTLFFSSSRHFCRFIFQHGHLFFFCTITMNLVQSFYELCSWNNGQNICAICYTIADIFGYKKFPKFHQNYVVCVINKFYL